MKMLLQFVRIATTACYFLPFTFLFVTCSGNNSKTPFDFAYNKEDAAENAIKDKDECFGCTDAVSSTVTDTASTIIPLRDSSTEVKNIANNTDTNKTLAPDTSSEAAWTDKKDELKSSSDCVECAIIRPTDNSESAIGIFFFYKDLFGKIVVGISLLLNLIIFIMGCFKKHNKRLIFVLTTVNMLSITAFVVDALINNVQLLYGAWLCLALIACSVTLQYWQVKRPTAI